MRLGKIKLDEWANVATYIDTLVIPVYSVNIVDKEVDIQAARVIEQISGELERRLAGRVLLLPSIPFLGVQQEVLFSYLRDMLRKLGHSGFTYQVIIADQKLPNSPEDLDQQILRQGVLYYPIETQAKELDETVDQEIERLYQEVLHLWQSTS